MSVAQYLLVVFLVMANPGYAAISFLPRLDYVHFFF